MDIVEIMIKDIPKGSRVNEVN